MIIHDCTGEVLILQSESESLELYSDRPSRPDAVAGVTPGWAVNGTDGAGGLRSRFSSVKVFHKKCRIFGGWPSVTVIHADAAAPPDAPGFVDSGRVWAASSNDGPASGPPSRL